MFAVSVCQSLCHVAQLCVVHSCSLCQITLASCSKTVQDFELEVLCSSAVQ